MALRILNQVIQIAEGRREQSHGNEKEIRQPAIVDTAVGPLSNNPNNRTTRTDVHSRGDLFEILTEQLEPIYGEAPKIIGVSHIALHEGDIDVDDSSGP